MTDHRIRKEEFILEVKPPAELIWQNHRTRRCARRWKMTVSLVRDRDRHSFLLGLSLAKSSHMASE
jgi:hypothetical protein